MVGFRDVRGSFRYSALVTLVGLGACTSVLDIQDLHDGPRPDAGTSSGATSSTSGGTKNNGGADNNGGNGTSGSSNTDAGSGNQPNGGTNSGGNGATSAMGGVPSDAGAGGEPVNTDPTVHGTLIDFWGHPLSNVIITIAGQQWPTDKDGKFTAENVPAEYDATLSVDPRGNQPYAWAFIGLTRRDPTLQIYQASEDSGTTGYVKVTSPALIANDTISASLGTMHGTDEKKMLATNDANGNYFDAEWQGPTSIMGTMHGLLWNNDGMTGLPKSYKGYYSKLITPLAQGTPLDVTLNLAAQNIAEAAIAGTVQPYGSDERTNAMFVRFDTGASIQVVQQTPGTNTFSYNAPTLPKSSTTIAASEGGTDFFLAFSIVHKDGLSPGAAAGTLKIPGPATPVSPPKGAMVDDTTQFSFSGSTDSKGAFVVFIDSASVYDSLHIVTSKKKFTLPDVPGFSWRAGADYRWRIETHGDFATVDQMAGPNGFADEFTGPTQFSDYTAPQPGAHQGDGSFTMSAMAFFTRK